MQTSIKKSILLVILIIAFLPIRLVAEEVSVQVQPDRISVINKQWKFKAEDNLIFKNPTLDVSSWDNINPYPTWIIQQNRKYQEYHGTAWYRLNLNFINRNKSYSIILPIQYAGSQIYFNGVLLHESRSFPPDGKSEKIIGKPASFVIPANLVGDKNILAMRTSWLDNNGGLLLDQMLLGPSENINRYWIRSIVYYSTLTAIIIAAGFIFFVIFLKRNKDYHYLLFSICTAAIGGWIFGIKGYANWIADHESVFILLTYGGALFAPPMVVNFTHSFLKIKNNLINILQNVVFVLFLVSLLAEFYFTGGIYFFQRHLYQPFIIYSGLANLYALVISIHAIRKKKSYAVFILTGLLFLLVSVVLSSVGFLNIANMQYFVAEGFFMMTIFFTLALATEFSQVHNELEVANSSLTVLDKMKDEFLANTSHELRTPLHGIIGLTESVLYDKGGELTTNQRENITLVLDSARHLNELVNEILEFSRLKAKKHELYYETINISDLAKSAASLLKINATNKNIFIECDIPEETQIPGDRRQLFQVFLNLLGNAIKFSEKGVIKISSTMNENFLTISIRDEGIGIPAESIERIWLPFEVGESSDNKNITGTGLGLPITKKIISMHGGKIWAESVENQGTNFLFNLPVRVDGIKLHSIRNQGKNVVNKMHIDSIVEEQLETENAQTLSPHTFDRPPVILIVDDDKTNLAVIENICKNFRYKLLMVSNAQEAFSILDVVIPDLILLDIMLPGISGFEICQKIRANQQLPFIPIIMLTARGFINDKIKGFNIGANDYLVKPFERTELLARIENMLAIKKLLDMEASLFSDIELTKDSLNIYSRSSNLQEATNKLIQSQKVITHNLNLSKIFLKRLMNANIDDKRLSVALYYKPLLPIGGDIYHIREISPGKIRVFLADATGHGINASLNSISILTEYALLTSTDISISEILEKLNHQYCNSLKDYKINFNCFIAEIDIASNLITYSAAGHPEQILIHSNNEYEPLFIKGPIIGLWPNATYPVKTTNFDEGSILALFTDGLLPGYSYVKGGYTTDKIASLLLEGLSDTKDLHSIINYINEKTPNELEDDITLLMIGHKLSSKS